MVELLSKIDHKEGSSSLRRNALFLYSKLIEPKSKDKDIRRREFILNILLVTTIVFSGLFNITTWYSIVTSANYQGTPAIIAFLGVLFFAFLLFLSRSGFSRYAAYLLIAAYFLPTIYTIYNWGVELPQGLLTLALIIVLAGVLVSSRFAFESALIISLILLIFTFYQTDGITSPKLYWKPDPLEMSDAIEFSITFIVIAVISWLSNRETEKSLKRARESEKKLKEERDQLEVRVEERTEELRKAQFEKVRQLYRFAEFGRLSSGLFHDLTNHLSALFLGLEKIDSSGKEKAQTIQEDLRRVQTTRGKLEDFMDAVSKQLRHQDTKKTFSLNKEIAQTVQILRYEAEKKGIDVRCVGHDKIVTSGDPIKFTQVVTNLVANAIDSYEKADASDQHSRKIRIILEKIGQKARLSVCDWGPGIPQKIIHKIFDPFFTTKKSHRGTGIGLSSTKEIVEKDLGGSIKVSSKEGEGSKFIVEFSIKKE